MFKMFLLYSVILVSVLNVSCQEFLTTPNAPDIRSLQQDTPTGTSDEIQDLRDQICQLNTKLLQQNAKIKNLELKSAEPEKENDRESQPPPKNYWTSKGTGSIFTRWGRRDCPRNVSELVYTGITGGSHYSHPGGAAEYVCLPPDPIWNVNKHYNNQYWGYMYGTEYENVPKPMYNYVAPCAVCRTSQFSTVLMIPARSECYQGWKKAYRGELVSGYYDHPAASQYVCLDVNPQINGTKANDNGKLMYLVRAKCGSLPCPPYENDTVLTCVVCLK